MLQIIKNPVKLYMYLLAVICLLFFVHPITAHAAWQNGSSNLSWSKTSGSYSVGIDSITYQYDFSSKELIVYLNGFSLSGWSAPWGKYSPEEREYWYPSLRIEPVYGSSIKFQDATWYDEHYGMKSWGYVGCDIYYYPYRPGSKVSPWFRLSNATNLTSITLQITGDSSYYGSSSSTTTTHEYKAQITINLTPASNQLKHSHNSSGVEYGQYNGTYHYKYTFCNGHGGDHSQNRGTTTEAHSYGSWSGWTDISIEQQRKQRSCSKCGYVDYAYQPRPYTISYNGNNGSISYSSNTIGYGSTLGTLPTGTRTAYTLKGFFTSASGGSQVSSGTTVTGNAAYYAQWTPVTYQIQYVVDTNNTIKNAVSNSNRTSYTIETATFNLVNPSRTGYTFEGWYTDSGLTNKVTSVSVGSYGNKTFYAKWKPITYSIRYILYNGTVSGNPSSYNIETATFTLKNPAQSGMAFLGWSGINDADTIITAPTASFTVQNGTVGNIVVSANWKPTDTSHGRTEVEDSVNNRFKVS